MEIPTAQLTYDGTQESRVRIRNFQRETFDDPGEPFTATIHDHNGIAQLQEMLTGQTIVRFPNGDYGIQVEAGEIEQVP